MSTTFSARHVGAGMEIVPELLGRQILMEGLVELAGDRYRQDELLGRVDDMLQGSQSEWLEEFRAALLRLADVSAPDGIRVGVGYPDIDARMPYVSIITEQGTENEGQACLGDLLGQAMHVIGTIVPGSAVADIDPNAVLERRSVIGNEWESTIQFGSWTEVPEESMLMHSVVKHILFRDKGKFTAAGVRELTLSESGFAPSEVMTQRTGYVPVVRCQLRWTWRQSRRQKAPYYWRLNPPTFQNE